MKEPHCRFCANDPPDIRKILLDINESITKDYWFERSSCTMVVLRDYIERLRNEDEYRVAAAIIDELRDKLEDALGLIYTLSDPDEDDRPDTKSQNFINRCESLEISDSVKNFHFRPR